MMDKRYESAYLCFRWAIIGLAICFGLSLAGCDERYRYPCQDPKNWSNAECKRPDCAINGVCPDQLNRPNDMKSEREP
jgi:hypothetical protein